MPLILIYGRIEPILRCSPQNNSPRGYVECWQIDKMDSHMAQVHVQTLPFRFIQPFYIQFICVSNTFRTRRDSIELRLHLSCWLLAIRFQEQRKLVFCSPFTPPFDLILSEHRTTSNNIHFGLLSNHSFWLISAGVGKMDERTTLITSSLWQLASNSENVDKMVEKKKRQHCVAHSKISSE